MKNERLHTDDQLKSITLKQIAIDAEKWPRKDVEQFFESQGLEATQMDGDKFITYLCDDKFTTLDELESNETELTLPDAIRWEELQNTVKCTDECTQVSALQIEVTQLRTRIAQLEAENK